MATKEIAYGYTTIENNKAKREIAYGYTKQTYLVVVAQIVQKIAQDRSVAFWIAKLTAAIEKDLSSGSEVTKVSENEGKK